MVCNFVTPIDAWLVITFRHPFLYHVVFVSIDNTTKTLHPTTRLFLYWDVLVRRLLNDIAQAGMEYVTRCFVSFSSMRSDLFIHMTINSWGILTPPILDSIFSQAMSVCTAESKFCYLPSSAVPSITSKSEGLFMSREWKRNQNTEQPTILIFLKFTTIHTIQWAWNRRKENSIWVQTFHTD